MMQESNPVEPYAVFDLQDYADLMDDPTSLSAAIRMAHCERQRAEEDGTQELYLSLSLTEQGMMLLASIVMEGNTDAPDAS